MSQDKAQKVLVQRQRKTRTDDRGRNVWADPVKSAALELVTTNELQVILKSDDSKSREAISKAAASTTDGVLARDATNGTFEIIDDTELQKILDASSGDAPAVKPAGATPKPASPSDEDDGLSLVNTQMLRKLLGDEEAPAEGDAIEGVDPGGGFDPYNNG